MYENIIELSGILGVYLSSMVAVACYKKDTSIANFTWGGGVLIVALYTFFRMSNFLPQQIIIMSMIALWSIRLIVYVYRRYTGEDPRFATWKWQGIKALIINIIWVFGQIIMIAIMSYPVVLINISNNARPFSLFDFLGVVIWSFGYWYESTSDNQLSNFIHNPVHKGHIMQSGLWLYSRHPNYLGESMMWWGIYCMALSLSYGWIAIITPITITFLLVYVTGIPLLENAMANNIEYQTYKQKTSKFIPWFTKK